MAAQIIDFLLAGVRDPSTDTPLASGTVEVYAAGTSTTAYVWDDRDKTLPTTTGRSTITLDAYGRAEVYGDGIYKFVLKTAAGVAIDGSPIDYAKYSAAATLTDLALTTAGSGSDLVGLVGAAAGYTLADWHGQIVLAPTIGLSPDNTATANSAAMTAWAATAPVGVKVEFEGGTYQFDTGFTFVGGSVHFEGNTHWIGTYGGSQHTVLEYTGTSGTFIETTTAGSLNLTNIVIRGYVDGGGAYAGTTVGLSTSGNVYAYNTTVSGFATGWTRTGGYYLKWIGGEFRLCNVCVAGVDLYNIAFIGTRFTSFNTGVTFNGGIGPINFIACSVEQWTTSFVTSLSSAANHINFIGGYIENYPANTVWSGLTGTYYNNAAVFTTSGSAVQIRDSYIGLGGVRRVLDGGSVSSLQATGNTIYVGAITGTHTGSDDEATVLTDSTKSWTTNLYAGWRIVNTTDGSYGTVVSNTATTITVTALANGTGNDWDTGDAYRLIKPPDVVFYATAMGEADIRNYWRTDPIVDGITPASQIITVAPGMYQDHAQNFYWNGAIRNGSFLYDFDVNGGAAGSITLGVIPDNATITKAWYEVITEPTSGGSATIAFTTSQAANQIVTATAYDNAAFAAGMHAAIPDGAVANFVAKTTALRVLRITIGTADLTAGKIRFWYEYVVSE